MMLLSLIVFVLALTVEAVHPAVRSGKWTKSVEVLDRDTSVPLSFALKQQNLDQLEKAFWAVSTPSSPSYGQYMSVSELTQLISPSQHTINNITQFLTKHKATDVLFTPNRDYVSCRLPLHAVEAVFKVKLAKYTHSVSQRTIIRSRTNMPHTIPDHLAQHVDFVLNIDNFPMSTSKASSSSASSSSSSSSPSSKTTEASNQPLFIKAVSRGGAHIDVYFAPRCQDGSVPTSFPICGQSSDLKAIFNVTSLSLGASSFVRDAFFPSSASSQSAPSDNVPFVCSLNAAVGVLCIYRLKSVAYYAPFLPSVSVAYSTSAVSIAADALYPTVATPPVTPSILQQAYNMPQHLHVSSKSTNLTQAVVEFEQQYYSPADLKLFFDKFGIDSGTDIEVIGPNDSSNAGGEANLDIQWMMALSPGVKTTFWSIAANSTEEIDDILQWAVAMSATPVVPLVNSLSYGMSEQNVDTYLGAGYIGRSNVEFQKLALRGVTIIIADGDVGANDLGDLPMSVPNCDKMHPDWPSQSPFVTAVGASYLSPYTSPLCYGADGIDCSDNPIGEVGVSVANGIFYTTGGGFSELEAQPSYQSEFVSAYLARTGALPPSNLFNSKGRAYPDVTAVGHNLEVALDGVFIPVDGTSASAPIFGGIVSMLNDALSSRGLPVLGFLNPLLYAIAASHPSAFNDITVGQNNCGAYSTPGDDITTTCCPYGYQATPGWDAVTGIGSPNFLVLRDAVIEYAEKAANYKNKQNAVNA